MRKKEYYLTVIQINNGEVKKMVLAIINATDSHYIAYSREELGVVTVQAER